MCKVFHELILEGNKIRIIRILCFSLSRRKWPGRGELSWQKKKNAAFNDTLVITGTLSFFYLGTVSPPELVPYNSRSIKPIHSYYSSKLLEMDDNKTLK